MERLIGCLLAASLLLFSVSTKSGNTPVGAELVAAGTPYSPGILGRGHPIRLWSAGNGPEDPCIAGRLRPRGQKLSRKCRARSE
jgi:hypothetical protein